MGILSEIDMMNRDAEDDAFEVSSDSETVDSFSEEFEPVEPPKQEPQAEDAEEARKKAEFDAAEAKRKAEWEAKQAHKKLREQQELDRLAAMSDDDVMQASMNRVSQDTERLTRRNMKLCVMEDVQTECLADPAFARLVMNPKKKMLNCFHYINRKAREYLEQENSLSILSKSDSSTLSQTLCIGTVWGQKLMTRKNARTAFYGSTKKI